MKAIMVDRQWLHQPRHFIANGAILPNPEQPERIDRLLTGTRDAGCTVETPDVAGIGSIVARHSPEYLTFLEHIHTRWERIYDAGEKVIPNTHAANRSDSYPKSAVGQAGFHQADTACPIAKGT